jgi:hypothetical protein
LRPGAMAALSAQVFEVHCSGRPLMRRSANRHRRALGVTQDSRDFGDQVLMHDGLSDRPQASTGSLSSSRFNSEKMSHAAINMAATTGPMTKPLTPKILIPPKVEINTM